MRGPAIDLDNIDFGKPLNDGLRLVISYLSTRDLLLARIDVKIKERQYSVAFPSGTPIEPIAGAKFNPFDDMITPKTEYACLNIKASKDEILRALKELVSDLEGDFGNG